MTEVAVVILAAGMSTRLGKPKQLLPLAGKPMVTHVARRARASKAERCIAIVGAAGDATQSALERTIDEVVINNDYAKGQGTSIAAAIRYIIGTDDLFGPCDAVVFVLGDQPGTSTESIDNVIGAWRNGAGIAMAQYTDRAGHPVLFDRQYWSLLAALDGEEGGRVVFEQHQAAVVYVPMSTRTPMDVDTEMDWRRLQEHWPE